MKYKDFDYISQFIFNYKTQIISKMDFINSNNDIKDYFYNLLDKSNVNLNNAIEKIKLCQNETIRKYPIDFLNFINRSLLDYYFTYEKIKDDIIDIVTKK